MEKALQQKAAPQRFGIPTIGTGNHLLNGPKATHAMKIKSDKSHQDPQHHRLFDKSLRVYGAGPLSDRAQTVNLRSGTNGRRSLLVSDFVFR